MRYADTLLIEGEQVALRTRQHWLALLINARYAFAVWLVALVLLVAGVVLNVAGTGAQLLGAAVLLLFVVGLVMFVIHLWQWWAQDFLITNRRLMKVWGVLNKHSVDSALEKVNDARLRQSVFGRIFNYGHLDILTASSETELDDYEMIRDPKGFKRIMLTQKHALEMSYYRDAPSPPLRAAMDINGERLPEPVVPPPPPGSPAATQPVASDAGPLPHPPASAAVPTAVSVTEPMPASQPTEAAPAPHAAPAEPAPAAPTAVSGTAAPPAAPGAAATPPAEQDTGAAASPPAAAPGAAATPPAAAPAAGDRSLEITQTLSRLADLRDRGAISDAEYEAKKRELLDRL